MATTRMVTSKSVMPEKAGAETPTTLLGDKSMRQYQIQDYEVNGATCPKCGERFKGRAGLSKHHNAQHGETFKPLAACDECGCLYKETLDNIHADSKTYCSKSCRKAAFSKDRSGVNNPQYKEPVLAECDECGEEYEHHQYETDRRFCSRSCYDSWQTGRGCEKDGKTSEDCEWCGSTFERYPSQGNGRFCSAACRHEWLASRTGQDHPLWQGGTDWYKAVRSSLGPTGWGTQRNCHLSEKCRLCGASEKTLALHHIVPVLAGGTNSEYNYMTLCRSCHSKAETYTRKLPGMEAVLVE